jgi:hypothetical protein
MYIQHAIAAIDSANPADRKGGILTLGESSEKVPGAKEYLFRALTHPLSDVRLLAASQVLNIDPSPTRNF